MNSLTLLNLEWQIHSKDLSKENTLHEEFITNKVVVWLYAL